MATFRIEHTRTDNLAQFAQIFEQVATDMMTVVLAQHQSIAQQLSPSYLGTFRNSFSPEVVKIGPAQIEGRLLNSSAHARIVEGIDAQGNDTPYGRRPGAKFPPVNILALWVRRVLGIEGPELRRVTYLVGRAIVRRGIVAERTSKVAYSFKEPEFQRMFEVDLMAQVEARI